MPSTIINRNWLGRNATSFQQPTRTRIWYFSCTRCDVITTWSRERVLSWRGPRRERSFADIHIRNTVSYVVVLWNLLWHFFAAALPLEVISLYVLGFLLVYVGQHYVTSLWQMICVNLIQIWFWAWVRSRANSRRLTVVYVIVEGESFKAFRG